MKQITVTIRFTTGAMTFYEKLMEIIKQTRSSRHAG